jgi:phosphate transport system substrate-binding protein
VTIKGSDTMVILAQRWSETYQRAHPDARIELTGGGSATGIAALLNRMTDLAASSIRLDAAAVARAEARTGRKIREIPVALDVLEVYVHPSNPIQSLTTAELRDILSGRLHTWRDVGGNDAPIAVYGRDTSSGSFRLIQTVVMGDEDFAENIESLAGTGSVADNVARDPNGLGYGGLAYARRVKQVPVVASDGGPPVLTRRLYLYALEPLEPEVEAFVAWTLGEDGQRVVAEVGYTPVAK